LTFAVFALPLLFLFQNLTPVEMDEAITLALQEQQQTEESLLLNSQQDKAPLQQERKPAFIEIPMAIPFNVDPSTGDVVIDQLVSSTQ